MGSLRMMGVALRMLKVRIEVGLGVELTRGTSLGFQLGRETRTSMC